MTVENEDDDLDRWLDTLAGRKSKSDGAAGADREAEVLRATLLRRQARIEERDATPMTAREQHAWERLSFRMRREGLTKTRRSMARLWIPTAAAAVLALVIGINLQRRSSDPGLDVVYEEPVQYRGGIVVVEVATPMPLARAQTLGKAMRKRELSPVLHFFNEQAVLDFEVPADKLDAVKADFEKNDVPTKQLAAGLVRVIFANKP